MRNIHKAALVLFVLSAILVVIGVLLGDEGSISLGISIAVFLGFIVSAALLLKTVPKTYAMGNILRAALISFILSAILMMIAMVVGEFSPEFAVFLLGFPAGMGLMLSAVLFLVWLIPKTVRKAYAWYTSRSLRIKKYILIALPALFVLLIGLTLFLSRLGKEGWTTYEGYYSVSALAVDKEGKVWAAHYHSTRLSPFNGEPVQIPLNAEMADNSVLSLAIDEQNRIWAGTISGLVCMRDNDGKWTIYTPDNFGADTRVWDIAIDWKGRAWIRSNSGLGMINPSEGKTTYTFRNSGLPSNDVDALTVDQQGRVWAINEGKVKVLESNGEWKIYALNSTPANYIETMAIDSQGQVWVGIMHDGVTVFGHDRAWTTYTLGNSKVALYIEDILIDKSDRVWVGANQGLFMFDPTADTSWTTYNHRVVDALCVDQQGRVWIVTSGRLSVFDIEATLRPKK
ncbi:MAG TPA: two-component regulator propeller domain-containing protein [Dehalococcoidales bacterium]